MKASALNLQAFGAKTVPAQGHWLIHLASGKALPLPIDPQPLGDKHKQDFNDMADSSASLAIQALAGLDHTITEVNRDYRLSDRGKADVLVKQREAAVITAATAWVGCKKAAAEVAERQRILYGAPQLSPGDTVGALADMEIRAWLRTLDVKALNGYLDGLLNGGRDAKAERAVEAVLRSHVPIGVGAIEQVVNAVWRNVVADRKPAVVASVQAAEQNVEFAGRVIMTCAGMTRSLAAMNELQLFKTTRRWNRSPITASTRVVRFRFC